MNMFNNSSILKKNVEKITSTLHEFWIRFSNNYKWVLWQQHSSQELVWNVASNQNHAMITFYSG